MAVVSGLALGLSAGSADIGATPGPLVVSHVNPRYFTVASGPEAGQAVYLTGSHIWNTVQDGVGKGTCEDPGTPFDFTNFLNNVHEHGQNFVRLWRWEQTKFFLVPFADFVGHKGLSYCVAPQPWARTGPGLAWDGKPRFDLTMFDQSYFDRLRARVQEAGRRGIYTSVMLFEGFCLKPSSCINGSNILGLPFNGQNNINGIDVESAVQYQSLSASPAVVALEDAYIRKVVDTVHDLNNVLYEVVNESTPASTAWQDSIVDYVRQYETEKGYAQLPIGMTATIPAGPPSNLFAGPADWVSSNIINPAGGSYLDNPPAADGSKVVIADTDHFAPCRNTALAAWKEFVRGLNPIMIDCSASNPQDPPSNPGVFLSDAQLEPARLALGDTRDLADSIPLISMTPRGDLTSTNYALADPGNDYVVLQPAATDDFTLSVAAGVYQAKWFDINTRTWLTIGPRIRLASDQVVTFTSPFTTSGPTVLYLQSKPN